VDDPALDLFIEPRLLHTQDLEGTWWRVVDAQSALALRGYDVAGSLVLAIADDELAPWNNGRWYLDAGPQGAEVRATTAAADIELSVRALSSLYSGNRSAQQLANAGLLAGDPDTVAKLDRIMRTRFAPHCPDHY
jgi:predicted acetyltransferase